MTDRLTRYPDWRRRLIAYLESCARRSFQDGEHDCALFLAGGIEAMTGQDYAAGYRGAYTSLAAGLKLLRKDGFEDHVDLARRTLPMKPVSMAREGDGAIVTEMPLPALGIVQGSGVYVLRETGLGLVPLTAASAALEV